MEQRGSEMYRGGGRREVFVFPTSSSGNWAWSKNLQGHQKEYTDMYVHANTYVLQCLSMYLYYETVKWAYMKE